MKLRAFQYRPGKFLENGAIRVDEGVNFTIHSNGAKSCSLCLFHVGEHEPYATIPFPESCRMGDTYSMVVYGLKPREFEYAYQFDGEYNPSKGLLFDKTKYILDPYARSVAGQEIWGKEKPGKERIYKARVVDGGYDWGNFKNTSLEPKDLIIYEMHVRASRRMCLRGLSTEGPMRAFGKRFLICWNLASMQWSSCRFSSLTRQRMCALSMERNF